jgi:large subunit ribosomal protein L18
MSIQKVQKKTVREKRKIRIRKRISGTASKPRLTVYRSLGHMYAQLVDDASGRTLCAASTKTKDLAAQVAGVSKTDQAKAVGKEIARLAQERQITTVVFDRNGYLYHGRVKAVAEGAREAGLVL